MKKLFSLLSICAIIAASTVAGFAPNTAQAVKFRRPLANLMNPPVSYYYDDLAGGGARDYRCGANTYNNHGGTDFRATAGRQIFASANGNLYYRVDNCPTYGSLGSNCGGGYGNHVRIDHEGAADGRGWVTVYAHMTRGRVQGIRWANCGTWVGDSGSSGRSSAPHLHFEVKKYAYPNNDPFSGACGGPVSFWNQVDGAGMPTTRCE